MPHRKPSLVEQYADYGSTVYAPLQRESKSPETWPGHKAVDTAKFQGRNLQEVQVGGRVGRRWWRQGSSCGCARAALPLPQTISWHLPHQQLT